MYSKIELIYLSSLAGNWQSHINCMCRGTYLCVHVRAHTCACVHALYEVKNFERIFRIVSGEMYFCIAILIFFPPEVNISIL